MKLSHSLNISALGLYFLTSALAQAEQVANLSRDFQKETFPEGWSYLWNDQGPLGQTEKYAKLEPTPEESIPFWTPTGSPDIPYRTSGFLYIGAKANPGKVRGHPGSPGPIPRYAIFAYTLKKEGSYCITESILLNAAGESSSGLELKVLVNDKEIITRTTDAGISHIDFDTKLGDLKAGDVVYVAVGAGKEITSDLFEMQYIIELDSP
jgi:hypothetical protein